VSSSRKVIAHGTNRTTEKFTGDRKKVRQAFRVVNVIRSLDLGFQKGKKAGQLVRQGSHSNGQGERLEEKAHRQSVTGRKDEFGRSEKVSEK